MTTMTANDVKNVAVNSLEGYTLTLKYWVSRDQLEAAMRSDFSETNREVTVLIDKAELIIKALEQASSLIVTCQVRDRASIKAGNPLVDHWKLSDLVGVEKAKKAGKGLSQKALEAFKVYKRALALLDEGSALAGIIKKYGQDVVQELINAGNISSEG